MTPENQKNFGWTIFPRTDQMKLSTIVLTLFCTLSHAWLLARCNRMISRACRHVRTVSAYAVNNDDAKRRHFKFTTTWMESMDRMMQSNYNALRAGFTPRLNHHASNSFTKLVKERVHQQNPVDVIHELLVLEASGMYHLDELYKRIVEHWVEDFSDNVERMAPLLRALLKTDEDNNRVITRGRIKCIQRMLSTIIIKLNEYHELEDVNIRRKRVSYLLCSLKRVHVIIDVKDNFMRWHFPQELNSYLFQNGVEIIPMEAKLPSGKVVTVPRDVLVAWLQLIYFYRFGRLQDHQLID